MFMAPFVLSLSGCQSDKADKSPAKMQDVQLMATRAIRSAYITDLSPPGEEEYRLALSQLTWEEQIEALTNVYTMVTSEEAFWKVIDPNHPQQYDEFVRLDRAQQAEVNRAQAKQAVR